MTSLKLVPSSFDKKASVRDTSNSLGLHDTLFYGPRNLAVETTSQNALKHRLENWEEAQDKLKLTMQRNTFGMHLPVRQLMERQLVSDGMHMPGMSRSNIHLDILMGRDETLDVTDVFTGADEPGPVVDIHSQLEKRLRV